MKQVLRTLGAAVPTLAIALFIVIHHHGPTVQAASPGEADGQAMASMPGMAGMSASDHIAHMAVMGNVHANHALDEMRWAQQGQTAAAPVNLSLPADDAGVKDRLAQSPRKGEYVKIDVGGTPMTAWVVRPEQLQKQFPRTTWP